MSKWDLDMKVSECKVYFRNSSRVSGIYDHIVISLVQLISMIHRIWIWLPLLLKETHSIAPGNQPHFETITNV